MSHYNTVLRVLRHLIDVGGCTRADICDALNMEDKTVRAAVLSLVETQFVRTVGLDDSTRPGRKPEVLTATVAEAPVIDASDGDIAMRRERVRQAILAALPASFGRLTDGSIDPSRNFVQWRLHELAAEGLVHRVGKRGHGEYRAGPAPETPPAPSLGHELQSLWARGSVTENA